MMGDLDGNQDGQLNKQEFVAGLSSKGVAKVHAEKAFDAIDAQKSGSINKADIEAAVKSGALKPPPGGPPPGGRPPGGRAGPPPGAGGGGSSSKIYDAADTNKDGKVSDQEALVYSIKHPTDEKAQKVSASKLGQNVDLSA
jgi:Ca2+-binding EF-hand superfamily protein